MTQVIVLAKSSEVSTFVQLTWDLPNKATYLVFAFSRKYAFMSGWTIHSANVQLDPGKLSGLSLVNGEHPFPGFLFPVSALHSFLRFLPVTPSGCSGSSISSVTGSVFSRALASLVEHPAPIRRHSHSHGESCAPAKAENRGWGSGQSFLS